MSDGFVTVAATGENTPKKNVKGRSSQIDEPQKKCGAPLS